MLIPGIGYEVNGSTRWVRIGIINLQVSEPARLCFLMALAGYLVRRNKSLREEFLGFLRPMVVLIIAFACHYCAFAAADLAGVMRLSYSPSVKVVRLPCTGKLDQIYVMRAFERGIDGVFVAG